MKTKLRLLFILLTTFNGFSQKKWTLKECVAYALENNISIKQNKLNIDAAETDIKNAKGNFLPTLNGNTSGRLNFGSSINEITSNRVSVNTFTGSIGLQSDITIFNGFNNINSKKQALLQKEGTKLDLNQIENDVALNVVNTYLNVLFSKENLVVANTQVAISKEQINRANIQFEAGSIPKGDVLNVTSVAATDLQNVVIQENSLNLALLQLAQLLQITSENFDVATIDLVEPTVAMLYDKSTVVYEQALTKRPEIKRAQLNIDNSELNIAIAKSAYLPFVTGSLIAGSSYGYNLNSSSNIDLPTQLNDTFGYGLGFNVNVPIFNGFKTDANVERSKINKEIAETSLENEKLQLQQIIEQAFLDAKAASKTYEASKTSLKAQKEAFKNAQVSYNYGAVTQFEFDQVRSRLVNAESTLINAKYDYVFKTKVLKFYAGENIVD